MKNKYGFWELMKHYEYLKNRKVELTDNIIRFANRNADDNVAEMVTELQDVAKQLRQLETSEVLTNFTL